MVDYQKLSETVKEAVLFNIPYLLHCGCIYHSSQKLCLAYCIHMNNWKDFLEQFKEIGIERHCISIE